MAIAKEIGLDPQQIDDIMRTEWNIRVATRGPGERINLTPMWFGWAGGKIYVHGRGQKIINLRKNPTCTMLVDRNEKFPELRGIMMLGKAHVLEDAAAEQADPHLAEVRVQMGKKYNGAWQATSGRPTPCCFNGWRLNPTLVGVYARDHGYVG